MFVCFVRGIQIQERLSKPSLLRKHTACIEIHGEQSSIPTPAGILMDGPTSGGPRPFPEAHNALGGTLIEW